MRPVKDNRPINHRRRRRPEKSSFVTKAGADEDELMQKLMAMIGGGAPVGRPTKGQMVAKENAIKGRDSEMRVTEEHYVLVRVDVINIIIIIIIIRRAQAGGVSMTFLKSLLSIVSALHDGYELTFFYFLLCVMHRKETRSNRSLRT